MRLQTLRENVPASVIRQNIYRPAVKQLHYLLPADQNDKNTPVVSETTGGN